MGACRRPCCNRRRRRKRNRQKQGRRRYARVALARNGPTEGSAVVGAFAPELACKQAEVPAPPLSPLRPLGLQLARWLAGRFVCLQPLQEEERGPLRGEQAAAWAPSIQLALKAEVCSWLAGIMRLMRQISRPLSLGQFRSNNNNGNGGCQPKQPPLGAVWVALALL